MRVLLDTNVLLDALLDREPWAADASLVWAACDEGRLGGTILASTLTDIFYIARKQVDVSTAQLAVGLCLQVFEVCPVDRTALEHAVTLPGDDFEDNVQIACAVIAGVDAIVTRDTAGFAHSPVIVLTPAALAAQL